MQQLYNVILGRVIHSLYIIKFKAVAECSENGKTVESRVRIMTASAYAKNARDKQQLRASYFRRIAEREQYSSLGQDSPHAWISFAL